MDSEQNRLSRAKALYREGKLPESEELFRTLLASPTLRAEAMTGIGMVRLQSGELSEASRMFESALEHKQNADAHYGLGVIAERGQSVGDAFAHFESALALNGDHQGASKRLMELSQRLARPGSAAGLAKPPSAQPPAELGNVAPPRSPTQRHDERQFHHAAFYQILGADRSAMSQEAMRLIDSLDAEGTPTLRAYPVSLAIVVLGGVIVPVGILLLLAALGLIR
jgi:tetratricopeptide (TPR) repeat protein